MDDIVPALLERIRRRFAQNLSGSEKATALLAKLQNGAAAYQDAGDYAYEVGAALATALGDNLSAAVLPEGRMYWNIAQRVIAPLLRKDHDLVSEYAATMQTALNKAAGLGLQAQAAAFNQSRVQGILDKVSSAPNFDDVAWVLDEPIKTFSQAVVDDTLKANVEFQGRAGLRPKIIRTAESRCCEWCSRMEGVYEYPGVPKDVYRRHSRCRCVVEYDPGSGKRQGKRQDVWSKRWTSQEERATIEARKAVGLDRPLKRIRPQYRRFYDGKEVNDFFYYDSEARGLLAKRKSAHFRWERALSRRQKIAIGDYCADGYADINNYWRKYGDWKSINAKKVLTQTKDLDDAISSYILKDNIQVYRAIHPEAFKSYWGNMQSLVGTEYTDPAFMSTSPFRGSTAVNKKCVMEINVPAGKGRGAYVNSLSGFQDEEYEFLIARNSRFAVQSVEESESEIIIKMEMLT